MYLPFCLTLTHRQIPRKVRECLTITASDLDAGFFFNYLNFCCTLVDQAGYGTNTSYLVDFIKICFKPKLLNPAEIKRFYLNEELSAAQIAAHYGVSKSVIIGWINRLKIGSKSAKGRMTNPNNFRHHNPPYGYKVKDNKLVLNSAELKMCRAVVEYMGRKKCSARQTARELEKRGYKNRRGELNWGHLTIQQIFKRWKDKL